jgi:tetratricopeptide (TPR) repeat protein
MRRQMPGTGAIARTTIAVAALFCHLTHALADADAKGTRRVVLFVYDSNDEHDTLLDAQLTLGLYPYSDQVSYWVSDAADGSASQTLAAYALPAAELPVVLLLDRDDAQGQPVCKLTIRRALGYEKNVAAIQAALRERFGLEIAGESPPAEAPDRAAGAGPEPGEHPDPAAERQERMRLGRKALSLGAMHQRNGNLARAEAYYLWAVDTAPDYIDAAISLARLYLSTRHYGQAVLQFQRAERLDRAYESPILLYDDFDDGRLEGWIVQRGTARVANGRLELTPQFTEPAAVGIQGDRPWRSYRLSFLYQDANIPATGLAAPSFSCAVRSTSSGAYWCRAASYGADIFKTALSYGHYLPRQLMLTNIWANDADWHERSVAVTTLPNGGAHLRWEEDGRLVGIATDLVMPHSEGAISFQTESRLARVDSVLVLRLD